MRFLITVLTMVVLMFPLSGCNDDQVVLNAYKTLKTCSTTYDAGMLAVAKAQHKGYISDATREEINKKARVFTASFKTAVSALFAYETTKTGDSQKVADAVMQCNAITHDLIDFITANGVSVSTPLGVDK